MNFRIALVILFFVKVSVNWFVPHPYSTWQWQLEDCAHVDESINASVYDIDLFDTPQKTIESLHSKGRHVVCYFSAGTWEKWRPDADKFPKDAIGKDVEGWKDEKWLDIRNSKVLEVLEERLVHAKQKGCDAIEADNVDGYTQNTGFHITSSDQIKFNTKLANASHDHGMGIALKNDAEQVKQLASHFDFAIVEQCFQYNECMEYCPFIPQNKAVFEVEYQEEHQDPDKFCPKANGLGFSSLRKSYDLKALPYLSCLEKYKRVDPGKWGCGHP